jgi:hypothetical protein
MCCLLRTFPPSPTSQSRGRDGSQAVPFVADVSGTSSAAAASGDFDWGDAAIGAGTVLGIVALLGATGLAIHHRRRVAPSVS